MASRLLIAAAALACASGVFVASTLVGACAQQRLALLPESQRIKTPPEIQQACQVAELKCSRCHDLERIKLAHHELVDWPLYVDKMRRQPGSGISESDGQVILKCLQYIRSLQRE